MNGQYDSDQRKEEIKLPLFCKQDVLSALPSQPRDRHFAIVQNLSPQPPESMGYLVELLGGRRARVLAWLARGGDVFACDGPLTERPDHDPEVTAVNEPNAKGMGRVYVSPGKNGGASERPVSVARLRQRESDQRFTVIQSVIDLGEYGKGYHYLTPMLAALFVACWQLPYDRGERDPWRTVSNLLDALLDASLPDALDALLYRGTVSSDPTAPKPSDFERFATAELERAGADRIRAIASAHDLSLRRLGSTGLFWMAFNADSLDADERATVLAVEAALNRLVLLDRALTQDNESSPFIGSLSWDACVAGYAATMVRFADVIETRLRACDEPNQYLSIPGGTATRGGEWDVRTRFAAAAEDLLVPIRLEYRFDCDARAGVLAVEYVVPSAGAFPQETDELRKNARNAYAVRLAAVLAAIAFGSGVGITRVVVTGRFLALRFGDVLCSFAFSRRRFTMEALPKFRGGAFRDASASATDLLPLLCADEARMELNGTALTPVEPIDPQLPHRSAKLSEDQRPLPANLADRYDAKTVADLDIFDCSEDALTTRVTEAREHAQTDTQLAINELRDIIDSVNTIEDLMAATGEDARRPLYCSNMVARLMAPQVEGFENGTRRYNDSAFDARIILSRIYREVGNDEDAIRLAQEAADLSPTSFSGYHALALALLNVDRTEEAAAVLVEALKWATVPSDIDCLYYRLAFVLWQGGDPQTGLACYAMINRNSYFSDSAEEEMRDLMREQGVSRRPTRDEATEVLRAQGINPAPSPRVREETARAATRFADAGLLNAAEAPTNFLSILNLGTNGNDVLSVVRDSFHGL